MFLWGREEAGTYTNQIAITMLKNVNCYSFTISITSTRFFNCRFSHVYWKLGLQPHSTPTPTPSAYQTVAALLSCWWSRRYPDNLHTHKNDIHDLQLLSLYIYTYNSLKFTRAATFGNFIFHTSAKIKTDQRLFKKYVQEDIKRPYSWNL